VIERFGATPVSNLDVKVDAVIISVAHKQFMAMNIENFLKLMNGHPVIIDVRGCVNPKNLDLSQMYYRHL